MDALRTDNLSAPLAPFLLASVLVHLLLAVLLPIVAIDVPPPVLTATEPAVAVVDLEREGFTMPLGSLRMQVLELAFPPAVDGAQEAPAVPAAPRAEDLPSPEIEVVSEEPEPVAIPVLEPSPTMSPAGSGGSPGMESGEPGGAAGGEASDGGAVGGEAVVTPPMIISMAWPEFPPEARKQIKVPIVLAVHVSEEGKVTEVRVETSSGCPSCEEAAIASAWKLRFSPARRGDEPIAMWTRFPVTFGRR